MKMSIIIYGIDKSNMYKSKSNSKGNTLSDHKINIYYVNLNYVNERILQIYIYILPMKATLLLNAY